MMLLGIDWFVVEDSSRKAKLVVSLYVVGFCIVQTRIFIIFLSATERIKDQTLLRYS
jgi:hypothetical protein